MTKETQRQATLKGKLLIEGLVRLETGLHIGASNEFAPIGAVDSIVVRDPLSKRPIIPGSSLKGKLRTLLVRAQTPGYVLEAIDNDPEAVQRLFGASKPVRPARLQVSDLFLTDDSTARLERMSTDLYLSEVKFENAINRLTSVANPRQIERVPAGAEFALRLVYNIERPEEVAADMDSLARAITLLHMDYLGGHGSRGYGRVRLTDFAVRHFDLTAGEAAVDTAALAAQLEAAGHALSGI